MAPSKNVAATTMTRSQAEKAGVLTFSEAGEVASVISSNTRRLYGFTRKQAPKGLPTEPKAYIFSVSDYGDTVFLCTGLPTFTIPACPEGQEHGEPCVINPMYIFEEAKVDVTEHTVHTQEEMVNAILKIGPGMNASWDRRKVGWFVSMTNPPAPEDLERAKEVYTTECKRLLAEGNRWAQNPQTLNEINEMHRRAARWLRQKVEWDKPLVKMVDCPGCGEPVKSTAIMHAVPYCGYVFNWEAAINSGMKKLEDAPEHVLRALEAKTSPKKNPSA